MQKTCYIFRGAPGSGKSTIALRLGDLLGIAGEKVVYLNMDTYRMDDKGTYHFDPTKVGDEVKRMKADFRSAIEREVQNVILDNVHSRIWEYEWAEAMACVHGYTVHVVEVQASFFECWRRHTHRMPFGKLLDIFRRWESIIRVPSMEDILKVVCGIVDSQ